MRQMRASFVSCHPVRIGEFLRSYMITLFFVKVTFQSASHMGPRLIKVCWKEGMIVPDQRKLEGIFGIPNSLAPWVATTVAWVRARARGAGFVQTLHTQLLALIVRVR